MGILDILASRGGLLNQPPAQKGFFGSPENLLLASSLLKQAQPSFTHQPSLGAGLGEGLAGIANLQVKRELESQNLTGLPQEYASLERLKAQLGENHPTVIAAQRALDMRLASQESMIDYRGKLSETADKRYSTSLGKHNIELQEIQDGFVPGTNRSVPIKDEAQYKKLLGQWNNKVQKDVTDPSTRERVLLAKNIHKTIANIDKKALFRYSGIPGRAKKVFDMIKSGALSKDTPEYKEYTRSLANVGAFAKQFRQYMKDSVTPSNQEDLKTITNPSAWHNSPGVAQAAFDALVDTLNQEIGTFEEALEGTEVYAKDVEDRGASPDQDDPLGWRK